MHLFAIIGNLRFQDVLDVAFLSIIVYHLYLWFQGTKALKALVGLVALGAVYTLARSWGLFLTTWVFQVFWQVLVILLIILFQSEIRQVLERVNPLQILGFRKLSKPEQWIQEFTRGIVSLARQKIGALIVIERNDKVEELITQGQALETDPTAEILLSIFHKDSPIHDGAVIISGGRLSQVACYLPLSSEGDLPKEWGTRHRAALGLSQRCDAHVVVVSEERGSISVAMGGEVRPVNSAETLLQLMRESIAPISFPKKQLMGKILFLLHNRWRPKLISILAVALTWMMLAGQQDFEVTFTAPLEATNVPAGMEILDPLNPEVNITIRGLRKDASTLNEKNVVVKIDLSLAGLGRKTFQIDRSDIMLPNDRIQVIRIQPPNMAFNFKDKK